MTQPIEDYALIGDTHTAGLVGLDGSIDWLCFPRFDSGACFAALLGTPDNGRWLVAPQGEARRTRRRYRPGTLVLETEFETAHGTARVIDCMPHREHGSGEEVSDVVRIVEGVAGRVPMRTELVIRFDYGWIVPWVRHLRECLHAVGGPDALCLTTPVDLRGEGMTTVGEFTVEEGDRIPFNLTWHPSHLAIPEPRDPQELLEETEAWWRAWSSRCAYDGPWEEAVTRSLITLKALTYEPTGGIVAAPTTSLPEHLGGVRNWDYRYCWLRDATFTLDALLLGGYRDEAVAWRDWLLRAAAGDPRDLQILYGPAGERRIPEIELGWLDGYEGSRPVRVGNAAAGQFQLDRRGHGRHAPGPANGNGPRRRGLGAAADPPRTPRVRVGTARRRALGGAGTPTALHPLQDDGVGGFRPVRHRRRTVRPRRAGRSMADGVHRDVCRSGYNPDRGAFTQYYGSDALDAALLMMPLVGFLPVHDERVTGTVAAIEDELCVDGFVMRYSPDEAVDGLEGPEGAFLLTTFWLVEVLALQGRTEAAATLFERLLAIRNDVGLLAEEYDPETRRLLGNFPQAFSHIGMVNAACALTDVVTVDRSRAPE